MANTIITISRQFGSGGRITGKALAERLGIDFYDRELFALASKESGINEKLFEEVDEKPNNSFFYLASNHSAFGSAADLYSEYLTNDKLFFIQSEAIRKVASEKPCVIVGRCSDYILRDEPKAAHIFICADSEDRVQEIMRRTNLPEDKARKYMIKVDKKRANYYNFYTGQVWGAVSHYNLCLNVSKLSRDQAVELIIYYLKLRGILK